MWPKIPLSRRKSRDKKAAVNDRNGNGNDNDVYIAKQKQNHLRIVSTVEQKEQWRKTKEYVRRA